MLNFDLAREAITDFDLAESMTLGTNDYLQSEINNHQLLLQDPFVFSTFKNQASGFWEGIVKWSALGARLRSNIAPGVTASNPQSTRLPKEEYVWKIHSFLDSQGKCHFCKKQCGNILGKCPLSRSP
jgi:hypothetical protein